MEVFRTRGDHFSLSSLDVYDPRFKLKSQSAAVHLIKTICSYDEQMLPSRKPGQIRDFVEGGELLSLSSPFLEDDRSWRLNTSKIIPVR